MAKSKYLGTTLTNDNAMREKIHRKKSRGISELLTKKYPRRSLLFVAIGHKHVVQGDSLARGPKLLSIKIMSIN